MCSLSWRTSKNALSVFFTRDESVLRPKAHLPELYEENGITFVMPKDPQGEGSWLAVNEFGLVIVLLNDYQGLLKPVSPALISRGLLVRRLASVRTLAEAEDVLLTWPLAQSQPFQLGLMQAHRQRLFQYDGRSHALSAKAMPKHLFSSGHPQAGDIIRARNEYVSTIPINSDDDLLALHKSHQPEVAGDQGELARAYSICMHRDEARSQSLTHIKVDNEFALMRYWDGQPCQTDHFSSLKLKVTNVV